MILSRTPFRVSFVGGGTDLREFYAKCGYGAVVSTAIQKYMYIAIHPYFNNKIRIKYSKTEDVDSVSQIKHPIVRECLRKVNVSRGIEITSFADVPAGTGLGSSSSFTVGLLNALYAYKGKKVSKEQLAHEAAEIEIKKLGEPIGKQDQYAAAYGDLNHIRFNRDESVDVTPIVMDQKHRQRLEAHLLLLFLGGDRKASSILKRQRANILKADKFQLMREMRDQADDLYQALSSQKVDSLGRFLAFGWERKKQLASGISDARIERYYRKAARHGALGAKVAGAGGTGFLLVYCKNKGLLSAKMGLKNLDCFIDREGSKIIYYDEIG